MQDVCFVAVFFFASGSGSVRCGLFCHWVGFPQWQLYASRFVLLVVLRGIGSLRCGLFCRRVGFPQGQLYAVVFLVRGGLRRERGLFCRGVFFCKRFWFRAVRFVLSLGVLHGFFLRKLVGSGCCLLPVFIFKIQSVAHNARIACKTIKSTHWHGI